CPFPPHSPPCSTLFPYTTLFRSLRPLEPLRLAEHQQVTVTVSDQAEADWLDAAFLRHLEPQADESITLEQVRLALAKIPGSMTRSEEHTSELQSRFDLVCRLLLE